MLPNIPLPYSSWRIGSDSRLCLHAPPRRQQSARAERDRPAPGPALRRRRPATWIPRPATKKRCSASRRPAGGGGVGRGLGPRGPGRSASARPLALRLLAGGGGGDEHRAVLAPKRQPHRPAPVLGPGRQHPSRHHLPPAPPKEKKKEEPGAISLSVRAGPASYYGPRGIARVPPAPSGDAPTPRRCRLQQRLQNRPQFASSFGYQNNAGPERRLPPPRSPPVHLARPPRHRLKALLPRLTALLLPRPRLGRVGGWAEG